MQDKRVGIASRAGNVYPTGQARICIPYGVDREEFIKSCFANGEVSIQPALNNPIHRVKIDRGVLQEITFPKDFKSLGSNVVFINMPKTKTPIVIACIDSIVEYGDLNENQFKISKSTEFGTVSIFGDADGNMSISISAERNKKGRFDISVSNPDNTAQFNINTSGSTSIYSSGNVSVTTTKEMLLKATDGTNTSSISITKDRIANDGGAEPMLLGQSTIDLLQEFINLVATATNAGGPLSTSAQIAELATQLNDLLSQKSNLD